jgi:very-short-patch-repair endonuclease
MYYFGCWDCVGHYLVNQNGKKFRSIGPITNIDGKYSPQNNKEDDRESIITHEKGWTILAMWDRSVDKRYGSNAAFIIEGRYTIDQMWEMASKNYPQIVKRLMAYSVR